MNHEPTYCPSCGSARIDAEAKEHKCVHFDHGREMGSQEGTYLELVSLSCTRCNHHWRATDEILEALQHLRGAENMVLTHLDDGERQMFYRVHDALEDEARQKGLELP